MPCEVFILRVDFFSKRLPLPWKWPKCKRIEKHKNDHSFTRIAEIDET
jgi:hypothetical protein